MILIGFIQVVKLVIVNMIVQNNATSPRTSSAESAVMQDTWQEIVLIESVELVGGMMTDVVPNLVSLELVTLWTENMRYSSYPYSPY